jgi:hypothetical protein
MANKWSVEVREERGKYHGFVLHGNDEYPAACDMLTFEAARQEAIRWANWMGL